MRPLLLFVALFSGCSRAELPRPAGEPTPEPPVPRESPSAVPAPSPAPQSTPEAGVETSVIEVRVVTRTPVDVGSIPNFDRPADPTPASEAGRRARCLAYDVSPESSGGHVQRLRIRVRNNCGFWIPAEQSWFEVVATPQGGQGSAGRATGSFQAPVAPYSTNVETFIEVECPGACSYTVSPR